jgi:Trk K+ transport system NAD-binding subunit
MEPEDARSFGDATSEDILLEAGIEKARGLVSVVRSDSDNALSP